MRHALLMLACAVGAWALATSASACGGECTPMVEPEYRESCSAEDPCVEPYTCVEIDEPTGERCLMPCSENCPCGFECQEMALSSGTASYCKRQ